MGFDNECILNIQSLPGEYFCPYCRTLVYPNEALQSQCTHLYCKPCLVYIAATTRACPYDGYLVTEADSKLLVESNKPLAETLGRVAVRCLYNRSGCQWQGSLSDCTTHCTECTFGNSAVICNRCGTQILHRQIQEHGQTCVGMQPEAQQVEGQIQDSKVQIQTVVQGQSSVASAAPSSGAVSTAVVSAPASIPPTAATSVQSQTQGNAVTYPHAAAQAPTPEQLHQQQQLQYQQYYQQFPGYDPYKQQYQQYAQYQQQIYPLYAQHQMQAVPQQVVQGQQPQPYMVHPQQPQHHPHSQPQHGAQPQPQSQPQLQPQPLTQLVPQTQPQPQHPHLQPQVLVPAPQLHAPVPQPHPQVQQIHSQNQTPPVQLTNVQPQQNQPPFHAQQPMQPHAAAHHPLSQPQQLPRPPPVQAVAQHQHPHPQMQHLQPRPQQQPHPLTHPHPQHQLPPGQTQPCPTTQPQPFAQPQPQPQFPPPPPVQQLPPGVPKHPIQVHPQQYPSSHSTHLHNQFPPQQAPQMRPPHAQLPMQVQQHQPMMLSQGSHVNLVPPQQQAHLPVHQQGQQIHQQQVMQPYAQQQGLPPQQAPLHPSQPQQQGAFPSQQLMRSQQPVHAHGPAYAQQVPAQPHFQQNAIPAPPNHQSQTIPARPMMPNDGMPQQPYQQATATSSMLMQSGMNQQQPNHNYPLRSTTQLPSSSGLHLGYAQENQPTQPASQVAMQSGPHTNTSTNKEINLSGPADLKNPESENDSKCVDIEETTASEGKVRINPNSNNSDNLESAEKLVENGFGSHAKDANTEVPVLDSLVKEENRESENVGTGEHSGKPSEPGQITDSNQLPDGTGTAHPHFDTDKVAKEQLSLDPDKNNQRVVSQGKISDDIAKNKHPQHLSHQSHQYDHKQQASSVPGQASYPMQQSTYGQPPALQDRMIPQHMAHPGPNQEQKFLEPLHHHIQAHEQAAGSSQMRPPMHNFSQPFPHQWQPPITHEAFQSPMGRTPHGHPHSEISRSNFQETDFPPPSVMAPGPSGSHQRNFQEQTLVPPGKEQNHMLPPGSRGPTFGIEYHLGRPRPNFVEAEGYAVKGTHFGGWQNDPQHSAVMSSPMTLNSVPPRGVTGGMHDERFGPVPEERHKPFLEQGFKLRHEEQFLPSAFGPGAPVVNRREFEEDLKCFPRPVHLDHGMPALDGYTSSMRPLERLHQPFGPDAIPRPLDRPDGNSAAWPLPSYCSGGSFAPKSDVNPTDIGDRPRTVGPFDVTGRKVDTGYGHPNHRMDGEFTGIQSGRFGLGSQSHMEDLGIRELPGFGNRAKAFNLPPSSSVGSAYHESKLLGNFLLHQRFGEQMGGWREFPEPGYVNRDGFPNEAKCFSSTFSYGGMDSFEHSMLRKPGSMGWCRICKIDCGSAEGLDLHSQTREHQKMSMNLVLSIKQENAKKQHLPNF